MQDQELRDLRRELTTIERGRGRHYPLALRARITSWARRRLAIGDSVNAVAREVALHPTTLAAWLSASSTPAKSAALVPVEVVVVPDRVQPTKVTQVVLVSPSGYRVEGLTLEDALRSLTRLR
jgi:transposase